MTSMMLPLPIIDHLLTRARRFQQLGRLDLACLALRRLMAFRELPAAVAEEVQARLGELSLRLGKPRRAQRHLALALRYRPDSPRYHYLLGRALDHERFGDPERALQHYRSALELDPGQPDALLACGTLLLRMGITDEGVQHLRAALSQAPDNRRLLVRVVGALRTAQRTEEARGLLLAARFRHPRDGRFLQIWNAFQFQEARREQQAQIRATEADEVDTTPVFLPFVPRTDQPFHSGDEDHKIIRHDEAGGPAPHHLAFPVRSREHRHAQ